MRAQNETEYQAPVGQFSLWFSMLGGPAAWALHLVVNYSLVPVACATGMSFLLYLTIPTFLGIAAIALFFGWRGWDSTRGMDETNGNGQRLMVQRVRFMGLSGILMSAFFLMVIIAQSVPIIMQDPCELSGSIRI
jgi:nicotinamide riboside transporter PnuC